ncbi:MAG TPA: VWA domain-containing protein [Candidatus Krumholzibacteria bacterium]|nr:VWA domain-containing protein [Candidatus Krumholzibacteria bacterium]
MNQSLQFGAPGQLWLLLLVPAALLLLLLGWRLRRQARSTWAGQLFGRLAPGYDPQREWLKIGLVLTAWAFVVLALARPQWGGEMVMMKRRGIDLMLAVDVSSSMLAEDMRPNRLQHAKRGISDLVNRMQGDRLGLVAFAGDAYTVCPLTLDHGTVLLLLESLGPNSVSTAGTNLAAAIARTRAAFVAGKDSHKALVLVTDGEGHEGDVLAEAKEAKKEGLVIYTIGIGSPTGEPIPERDEGGGVAGYKKDRSGHVVSTRLDEATLLSVAQETGGKYFRSTPQGLELTVVADELQKIEKKELEGRVATSYEERFQWPLGIAVLLLMTEFLLPARRRRRTGPDLAVAGLLCALLLTGGVPRQAATRNREGTQAYTEKRYGEAVDKYTEALTEAPEAGGISYNLGNALYREQHYQDAATALARAAQGQDPSLRHRSLHNLGNTFFKMGKLPEALQAYRQALAARPDDRDTKINYEKALRLAQQQEQQQQKQPKSGDKKDEEKNEQEQQQQQKENEQQQQQQQQEQNGGEQKEQNQPQEQKTESAADSVGVPEGELRPEEAMRILEAMRDREKELQKEKAEKARLRARRVDKDW